MMKNKIICGNSRDSLEGKIDKESIDIIYIDPPFDSKRVYRDKISEQHEAFSDMYDKAGEASYISTMKKVIENLYPYLKESGTFWLHNDERNNYKLRIILDEVYGEKNFVSQIIWKRTGVHGDSGTMGRVYDTITVYAKNRKKMKWNKQYIPYTNEYIKKTFNREDVINDKSPDVSYPFSKYKVRKYAVSDLTTKGLLGSGYRYEWNGRIEVWRCPKKTMERYKKEGLIYYTNSGTPLKKRYLDEAKGKAVQNLWMDITLTATEYLGFATQKPLSLMERIIKMSTDEGDIVLDGFLGTGTMIVAAHKLKRKWIGIDISPTQCSVAYRRVWENEFRIIEGERKDMPFDILNFPCSPKDLDKLSPIEYQRFVACNFGARISKKMSNDRGIDGTFESGEPLQVKQNKANSSAIREFATVIRNAKKTKGIFCALDFTRECHREMLIAKKLGILIIPVTRKQLLNREYIIETLRKYKIKAKKNKVFILGRKDRTKRPKLSDIGY